MISNGKIVEDKVQLLLLCTFLDVMVASILGFYLTSVMLEKKYQNAVDLINNHKWYQAEQVLKSISSYKYKDGEILENYAKANIKLDLIDKKDLRRHNYSQVIVCLNKIPDDYQGIFNHEVCEFKHNIMQKANLNKSNDNNTSATSPQKPISPVMKCFYFEGQCTYPMFIQ